MSQINLPDKFIQRLGRLFSAEELEKFLEIIKTKPLPSFRINNIKATGFEVEKELKKLGFLIEKVSWYKDAFILKNKSIRELTDTQVYKNGQIYIQNLSSMIPALILDPEPNDKILDLCAAPGSKTSQIADLMSNQGEIFANDLSRERLYKLTANLKSYGITNTKILNLPGQIIWKKYPEYFDKTLVDVPCSMEGRINLSDPDSYKDWSLRKIKELEVKQRYLLRSAISATKVGGIIVYSTCTLAPEENEEVLDWILKKEGDAIGIEKIKISNLDLRPGLAKWNKDFNPQVLLSSRVFPTTTMEGFFIAKIRKKKSTIKL